VGETDAQADGRSIKQTMYGQADELDADRPKVRAFSSAI
jgi:hypothetical protein